MPANPFAELEDKPAAAPNPFAALEDTEQVGAFEGQVNTARRAFKGVQQSINTLGAVAAAERLDPEFQFKRRRQETLLALGKNPQETEEQYQQRVTDVTRRDLELMRGSAMDEQFQELKKLSAEGLPGQIKRIAELQGEIEKIPESADVQTYQQAPGFLEKLKVVAANPIELPTNIAVRGAISSVPVMAAGTVGALGGGPIGGAMATGAASYATDVAGTLLESFTQAGVDIRDPEQMTAALADPQFIEQARLHADKHGVPVAIFDALSAGIAGRIINATRMGARDILRAGVKEIVQQGALGASGEASGQLVAEGKITDPTAIFEEAVGEIVPGVREITQNVVSEQLRRVRAQAAAKTQVAAAAVAQTKQEAQTVAASTVTPVTDVVNEAETQSTAEELQASQDKLAEASRATNAARVESTMRQQQAVALLEQAATEELQLEAALQPPAPVQPTSEELTNAGELGATAQTGSQEQGLQQEADERLRLRNDAQNGMEAVPGEVVNAGAQPDAQAGGLLTPEAAAVIAAEPPEKVAQVQAALANPNAYVQYTVWPAEMVPAGADRVAQVDVIDPTLPEGQRNVTSTNRQLAAALGRDLPAAPEWLPMGRYTETQIRDAIVAGPPTPVMEAAPVEQTAETVAPAANPFAALEPAATPPEPTPAAAEEPFVETPLPTPESRVVVDKAGRSRVVRKKKAAAKPEKGIPRGRGFIGLSKRPSGVVDILDAIEEVGGINAPEGALGEEVRSAFKGQAKVLVRKTGGLHPAEMAKEVFADKEAGEASFGDGYVSTMLAEVERAVDERTREARAYEVEVQRGKFENAVDPAGTVPTNRKTEIVPASELVVGDKFEVFKEPTEVVDIDPDLDAPVVRDGDRYPGEFTLTNPEVRIDAGSLERNEAGRAAAGSFFEGGTIEEIPSIQELRANAQSVADPRSGQFELLPTGEGFSLMGERGVDAEAQLRSIEARRALEQANQLIPGTEQASFAPTRSDKLINTLNSLKLHQPGELFAASPLSLAWDAAIDTAILAIKAGRVIGDVITTAVAKFRELFPDATPDDVTRLEQSIRAGAQEPATTVPNANPANTSAEDFEAADTGELSTSTKSPTDPIVTKVFGEEMTVNGRRQLTPEERDRARGRAESVFNTAGLPVVWDATNEVFRLADPTKPAQAEGKKLLALVRAELAKGVGADDPLLSVLINSIRNPDGGLWTSPAFTPALRNQLFSVAQAEASFYGLMLGALAAAKRSLEFIARHVDTVLHKAYSDAFSGNAIGTVMDRVSDKVGELTDAEITAALGRTPEGAALLERLRNGIEDPTELETFIAQLFRQSGDQLRITAAEREGLPARIAALFPTEEWRRQLEKSGGKALESSWWQILNGPSDENAGNVQLMDRALQSQLGGILRETMDKLGLVKEGVAKITDEEKLAMALGEGELRRAKIARADAAVRQSLNERETAELEALQAREDLEPEELAAREVSVQAKWEKLRLAWDEATTQMTEQPASAAMLRRMVNAEARDIFKTTNLDWSRVLDGDAQTNALRNSILARIEKKMRDINARSPSNALPESDLTTVQNSIGKAFDAIVKDKKQKRDASAAVRALANHPNAQAERMIERLARQQSDTLSWDSPQQASDFQVIMREYLRGPMERGAAALRLAGLGLEVGVINRLLGVATRQREIIQRHKQLERERRTATPNEGAQTPPGLRRPGLRTLIDAVMNASQELQRDPAWIEKTVVDHLTRNGLTPGEAKEAATLFRPELERALKLAKERALEQVREGLQPKEIQQFARVKHLWERIQHAVNAGIFDSGPVLEQLARENGWTIPTAEQRNRMRALADREQELRTLTPAELTAAGPDIAAQQDAQRSKEAATTEERIRLRREMQTLWSRFTRPITFRTPEGRRNVGAAGSEFLSANMLLKLGFFAKQPVDVLSQAVWHMPSRALAAAAENARNDRAVGRETRYWTDVAQSLADAGRSLRDSAGQAMTQFRQGIRGRGEIRAVEGIVPAVSIFDRFRQRAQEASAAGQPALAAAYHMMGWLRFALSYARAFDNVNGTLAEVQETRERLITELRLNGRSPEQARADAADIIGDKTAETQLALVRAKEVLEAEGFEYNKTQLAAAAYEIYKARQYARMQAAGLDADSIRDSNEVLRQTVGWNQKEPLASPGGIIAAPIRAVGQGLENIGLPLPIGRFANAIAIGTNRALTWTPLGFFPGLFGGEENAWFATHKDRVQRKYEAAMGSAAGVILIGAALNGMLRVWNRPPQDPEDRDLWEKEGHRPGTVEFITGPHSFVPVAMSTGPLAYLRPYLGGIGELQDAVDRHEKTQRQLAAQAEKRGLEPPTQEPLGASDVMAATAWGAYQAALGGRTAGGAVRSFTNDNHVPDLKMLAASQASPFMPLLPAYQEMRRAFGVHMDQAHADFSDLLVPTSGSANNRRNFLGDQISHDLTQNVVQTLTGGTYPVPVDSASARSMAAYRILSRITWRPAPIGRNSGFEIDGKLRPLTDEEFFKVLRLRGAYLKAGLNQINENQSVEDIESDARDVGRDAREDALRDGAGAHALTLEQVNAITENQPAPTANPFEALAR